MPAEQLCALCCGPGPLMHSHIISEFLYQPVYDEKHRFEQISTDPNEESNLQQKGLREYLLCSSCEGKLGKWESYAKKVLDGGIELERRDYQGGMIISPIDYSSFKLFSMSLLWRAGVATRSEFSKVQLGSHQEVLRKMLLEGNSGRFWEYGFSMAFVPEKAAQEIFGKVIFMPECIQIGSGLTACRFLLGNVAWLFLLSDQMQSIDARLFALSEDGKLILRSGGQPMMDYLVRVSTKIAAKTSADDAPPNISE